MPLDVGSLLNTYCVQTRKIGGAEEDRTPDLLRARQALSQLSYGPGGVIRKTNYHAVIFENCPLAALRTHQTEAARQLPAMLTREWWVWVELNHRPHPYQGSALTN